MVEMVVIPNRNPEVQATFTSTSTTSSAESVENFREIIFALKILVIIDAAMRIFVGLSRGGGSMTIDRDVQTMTPTLEATRWVKKAC